MERFSPEQIAKLQTEYSRFDRISTDRLADFHRIFDGCSDAALAQLSQANIKFVSKLALVAFYRRGA